MGWWHVVLSTVGRMPIFVEDEQRREAVRTLARVAGRELALFSIVDDHVHLVLSDEHGPAWVQVRSIRLALARVPGFVALQPTWMGPIEARSHAQTLLGYGVVQPRKHGLSGHPALWSGSCLADLIGARRLAGFDPERVRKLLPRYRPEEALRAVGVPDGIPALDDLAVRRLGAGRIADAAVQAFAAPSLDGNEPVTVRARRAAAVLQARAGIPAAETAFSLGQSPRSATRMRSGTADEADVLAVRTRLALEEATKEPLPTT